jgi:hypothetical protein
MYRLSPTLEYAMSPTINPLSRIMGGENLTFKGVDGKRV